MMTSGSELRAVGFPGHALDFKRHWTVKQHAKPEALSRDLGVVKNYEQLLVEAVVTRTGELRAFLAQASRPPNQGAA